MNTPVYYQCIPVNQPLGTFYFCTIQASEILPIVSIERRGLSKEEQQNVQRSLDPKRQFEISKYVREPDATFPTSVTLSADSDYVHIVCAESLYYLVIGIEDESRDLQPGDPQIVQNTTNLEIAEEGKVRIFTKIPEGEKVALVVDGQHRMEGLRAAGAEQANTQLGGFEIPLIFMFDLSSELMARIFVTINANQRKVDSSLISDLFGLSSRRSPKRTSHIIATTLNSEVGGPFSNGLKMLGKRRKTTEFLSQGSFCKYLLKLISNTPDEDERRLQKNEPLIFDERAPLRTFFIDKKDDVIVRIVKNYFTSVMNAYPEAWTDNPADYLIRKTVGFAGLIRSHVKILPTILRLGDASILVFDDIFESVKTKFALEEWAVGKFSSSEADASRIANTLYRAVESDLSKIIEGAIAKKANIT